MSYKTYALGDLIEKWIDNRGKTPPLSSDGIPLLEVKHLPASGIYPITEGTKYVDQATYDSWFRAYLEPQDILFSTVGTTARVIMTPENRTVAIAQNVLGIRFKKEILDPWYMFYYMRGSKFQHDIKSRLITTVQASIKRADMVGIEVDVPPLSVQKSIVEKVYGLDRKVELNHQINQTLEQMAQAIFKSWFVDFEPVKAKIAALEAGGSEEDALLAAMQAIAGDAQGCANAAGGRTPVAAKGDKLTRLQTEQPEQYAELRATAELFPSAMQDSELGEIPEGWTYGSLGDVANFSNNRVSKDELTLETYISTENMLENRKGVCLASSLPSSASVPSFEPGEILISNIRPYFKKIWLANISGGRSPDVLGFTPRHNGTNEYLFNLLYQDNFFEYMMLTSKGAKMPRGDKRAIMQLATVIPPIDLMRHFSEHVRSFYLLATSHNRESDSLVSVRDSLLPKLLSGELAVSDGENQLMAESMSPLQEAK